MRLLPFRSTSEQIAAVGPAIEHLRAGGLVAYPTETVYGFGCALLERSLDELTLLKGDRADKSFLIIVGERAQVRGLHWTPAAQQLAECFWPGPLTLVLRQDHAAYPARVLGPGDTVAVRWTAHPGLQRLLSGFGAPITSTSANRSGQPPALTPEQLRELVTETDLGVSLLLLDGGPLPSSAPSTLVDCSTGEPRVIRTGAISIEELKRCVHDLRI